MNLYLPMRDISEQCLCHGSVNAGYTQLRSTGVEDATLSAFDAMLRQWEAAPVDETFLTHVEAFQAGTLAEGIRSRLAAVPELTDLPVDAGGLRRRLETLNGLRARSVSKLFRTTEAIAVSVADEAANRLREALDGAFAKTPHRIPEITEQTKAALRSMHRPDPPAEPYVAFSRLVRGLEEIEARPGEFTPANHETIVAQLAHRARESFEHTLRAVSLEFALRASRHAVERVEGYLDELLALSSQFDDHLRGIRSALEEALTRAAEGNRVSRASVVVPLDGPDEREVLAGMVTREGCADLQELVGSLRARLEPRLREVASRRYAWIGAADAPISRLVAAIDPAETAAEFMQLVVDSLGSGHTLYQVIEQYGVRRLAQELFERAAHTCHLRGRDNELFNVPTVALSIVRLPQPVGSADIEIRQRLGVAFEDLDDCTVTEGSSYDKEVTIVRVHVGWPLAIEQNTPALLVRYHSSAGNGHRPHLLGIIDDAPNGEVSPRYIELAEKLNSNYEET